MLTCCVPVMSHVPPPPPHTDRGGGWLSGCQTNMMKLTSFNWPCQYEMTTLFVLRKWSEVQSLFNFQSCDSSQTQREKLLHNGWSQEINPFSQNCLQNTCIRR